MRTPYGSWDSEKLLFPVRRALVVGVVFLDPVIDGGSALVKSGVCRIETDGFRENRNGSVVVLLLEVSVAAAHIGQGVSIRRGVCQVEANRLREVGDSSIVVLRFSVGATAVDVTPGITSRLKADGFGEIGNGSRPAGREGSCNTAAVLYTDRGDWFTVS